MYNYEYIRKTRVEKGLTLMKVAELLEMDMGNYSKLERGIYKTVPCHILKGLYKVLGLDLHQLLNLTDQE